MFLHLGPELVGAQLVKALDPLDFFFSGVDQEIAQLLADGAIAAADKYL